MHLIVPSIRGNSFHRFLDEWALRDAAPMDLTLTLMEDNPTPTFELTPVEEPWAGNTPYHFSWRDIEQDLKERSWIIPRRSDTVRSYAYYRIWRELKLSGQRGLMLTLDDDCYPSREFPMRMSDLCVGHTRSLFSRTRWFNTLNGGKPRGIPFKNLGERETVLNHGLWQNVLDYDAPTQLVDPFQETFDWDNKVVPSGQYFPMCGMNVMWQSDITVLMYHLLMGCVNVRTLPKNHEAAVRANCLPTGKFSTSDDPDEPIDVDHVELYRLPYDRFGDIWCGILMKRVCDHLGLAVSTGTPYIHHDRASDPFTNLIKEAQGLKVNEVFWERIDGMDLSARDPAACYREIGLQMKKQFTYSDHPWYFEMLGEAMVIWASLFR